MDTFDITIAHQRQVAEERLNFALQDSCGEDHRSLPHGFVQRRCKRRAAGRSGAATMGSVLARCF
jgi:hypothetical protein